MTEDTNDIPNSPDDELTEPFVRVTVVDAVGSTPADAGAKMLVIASGLHCGSVGGGRIEAKAITEAQALLQDPSGRGTRFVEWNLQKDVGMTCGGSMRLYFERGDGSNWQIVVFGAGHVAQTLIRLLLTLPCRITCVDSRSDWLQKLPRSNSLRAVHMEEPAHFVEQIPANAVVLSMTKGHASDRPILEAILKRDPLPPFLGVIGSKSKAAILKRELREHGVDESRLEQLVCPIGLPIGSNHTGEIAVSIAAQLIQVRDQMRQGATKGTAH